MTPVLAILLAFAAGVVVGAVALPILIILFIRARLKAAGF